MDFRVNGLMLFQKELLAGNLSDGKATHTRTNNSEMKLNSPNSKNRGLSIESAKIQIKIQKTEIKLIISGSPTSNALKRLISV